MPIQTEAYQVMICSYLPEFSLVHPGVWRNHRIEACFESLRIFETVCFRAFPEPPIPSPAYQPPQEGQAPPIGDGSTPYGVTPGHRGYLPELPASQVQGIPQVPAGESGKSMINGYVAPYLSPPTQYDPADPGSIDSPPNFSGPPVTTTTINLSMSKSRSSC